MGSIRAIQQTSVHQIQSGQVIVDLNSVVKELVENSLDAGATSIEVRFRNHGLDAIEVVDNGSGIAPEDYESVALKHHTSKLNSYDDLESLNTFGFRGEALASLCALSQLHVITAREADAPKGKKLTFEDSGKLKDASLVATQRGTKVVVEKLFHNLPVRKKELEKNVKREYGKVLSLLQAYACISTGVRFVVSNQMAKANKNVAFATSINNNTKDNITNVFGVKTLHALVKLDLKLEMNPTNRGPSTQAARIQSTQADASSQAVTVQGHISRPVFGEGRQAPDRQFFFVNSRPCGLPQVAKAFNEVYRSFNVSQSPFIFANLIMDTHAYDVNVSPDKRTILLHDQAELLESLKAAMLELFEAQEQSVPQSKLLSHTQAKLPSYKPLTVARQAEPTTNAIQSGSDANHASSQPETPRAEQARRIRRSSQSDDDDGSADDDVIKDHCSQVSKSRSAEECGEEDVDNQPIPLISQRGTPERLIHSWIGRSTIDREDIPKISTSKPKQPSHPTLVSVPNAFERMRPPRTPAQIAEITIGDKTTSTVIGTGSSAYKRRRIHTPKTPVISRGLRGFAMPGSQMEADEDDEDEDGDLEGNSEDVDDVEQGGSEDDVEDESHLELDDGDKAQSLSRTVNAKNYSDDYITDNEGIQDEQGEASQEYIVRRRALPPPPPFVEESTDEEEDGGDNDSIMHDQDTIARKSQNEQRYAHAIESPEKQGNAQTDESDEEYLDEDERKSREDEKIARLMQQAEEAAALPTADNLKRANQAMRGTAGSKHSVLNLSTSLDASVDDIRQQAALLSRSAVSNTDDDTGTDNTAVMDDINKDSADAEAQLSLTVTKSDFASMTVAGQFNLGFIIAVRPNFGSSNDDLFIIDQHAADEKYNFERFTRSLTIEPQRLAQPKQLYLTAVEEEIILSHSTALTANGFLIETDTSGEAAVGERCKLISLPTSKEKTFDLSDLEELLHLLSDHPENSNYIPRPGKVRKMLAMRACRSSIMVGKTLTQSQMVKVVRNLGEMDKPWNCPHGRPTMRHLAGLGGWVGWDGIAVWEKEDGTVGGGKTDWSGWLTKKRMRNDSDEE